MFRIFGPPGTGKTTTLLNMVDKALEEGTPPLSIAFLAFTRKAATEAKERAAARFKLDPKKDLFYFRTLHSLALTLSDIKPEQIMQPENYKELSLAIGINLVSGSVSIDDDISDVLNKHDPIISLINLARIKKNDLRDEYNHSSLEDDWNTVNFVAKSLHEYKTALGLYDFTDMLQSFVDDGHRFGS
jgi:superfamily I DNA/RNA helicase